MSIDIEKLLGTSVICYRQVDIENGYWGDAEEIKRRILYYLNNQRETLIYGHYKRDSYSNTIKIASINHDYVEWNSKELKFYTNKSLDLVFTINTDKINILLNPFVDSLENEEVKVELEIQIS